MSGEGKEIEAIKKANELRDKDIQEIFVIFLQLICNFSSIFLKVLS